MSVILTMIIVTSTVTTHMAHITAHVAVVGV